MKHGFAAAAMRLIKLKISQCWPHRNDASWIEREQLSKVASPGVIQVDAVGHLQGLASNHC